MFIFIITMFTSIKNIYNKITYLVFVLYFFIFIYGKIVNKIIFNLFLIFNFQISILLLFFSLSFSIPISFLFDHQAFQPILSIFFVQFPSSCRGNVRVACIFGSCSLFNQGYQVWHPNQVRLAVNRPNLCIFKISFSTFWLGEPKCTKSYL